MCRGGLTTPMRTARDSALCSTSFFGRADASVQSDSVQSAIVEYHGASLRLNPLVLFGLVSGGADDDITHVRDDGIGPNCPRADIVAHSRQAIATERLGLDGTPRGWPDAARAWLEAGHALSARSIARLRRAATTDPVRSTVARGA